MKKWIILVVALLMLTGCSAQKTAKYEIVVVPRQWSQELDRQIEEHVAERDELNVYQNMAQEADALYQKLLLQDLMAQGVDAVCLEPVEKDTVAPMVEELEQAGVVVVTEEDLLYAIDRAAELLEQGKTAS